MQRGKPVARAVPAAKRKCVQANAQTKYNNTIIYECDAWTDAVVMWEQMWGVQFNTTWVVGK